MMAASLENPEQARAMLPRLRRRSHESEPQNTEEGEFSSLFNCSDLRRDSEERAPVAISPHGAAPEFVGDDCSSAVCEPISGLCWTAQGGAEEGFGQRSAPMHPPKAGFRSSFDKKHRPAINLEQITSTAKQCLDRLEARSVDGFHDGNHTEADTAQAVQEIEAVRSCMQSYQAEMLRLKDIIKSQSAKIYANGGETLSYTDATDDASVTSEVVYDPIEQTIDTLEQLCNRLEQDHSAIFIDDNEKRRIRSLTHRICSAPEEYVHYSDGSEGMSSGALDIHSSQRKRQRYSPPSATSSSLTRSFSYGEGAGLGDLCT